MDIRYYFDEVDFSGFHDSQPVLWKYSLGSAIEKTTLGFVPGNTGKIDVALFGVPFYSSTEEQNTATTDLIRRGVYGLSKFSNKIRIADFGNLKPAGSLRATTQALRDITEYLAEENIVTVVIGGSQDLTIGICEAFHSDPFFSLSCIDALFDIKKGKDPLHASNFLSYVFSHQPEIFQFNLIGYQSHFVPPELLSKAKGINQHLRLGMLKDDLTQAEPVIRNSDVVSFDMCSVLYSEAPGTFFRSPNGLRSDEACQLARYAGLNNRLKAFGLFGVKHDDDRDEITISLASQVIWYLLDGISNRIEDSPGTGEQFNHYRVQVSNVDQPLVFMQHITTGQWWVEIPLLNGETKFFACTEKEYLQASQNEIPGVWLKYIQKSDEILK